MDRERALRSALERLPMAVIVVEGGRMLQPYNRHAVHLFEQESLRGDILNTRPSHPLSEFIQRILEARDIPDAEILVFPSGTRYRVEPSRRSDKGRERLLMLLIDRTERTASQGAEHWGFTERETEIARMLAGGKSSKDICSTAGIAPNTLKTHVRKILEKTRSRSRAEFIAKFHRGE